MKVPTSEKVERFGRVKGVGRGTVDASPKTLVKGGKRCPRRECRKAAWSRRVELAGRLEIQG